MPHSTSSRRAPRGAVSVPTVLLVIVLIGVLAMVVYRVWPREERAPFALFHLAPGMSHSELEKTVKAVRGNNLTCRNDTDVDRQCDITFSTDPGIVTVFLDSQDRVRIVQAVAILGRDGVPVEAESQRKAWNHITFPAAVPPILADGDTGAVRWTSPDGRWTAELHYNGLADPDRPNMVLLVDTRAVKTLADASQQFALRAKDAGWIPPTWDDVAAFSQQLGNESRVGYDSMPAMLTVLREKQNGYWSANHRFALTVSDLDPRLFLGRTNVRILSATDSGWTAEASDQEFPGISCVTIGGSVPREQWPLTAGGAHITFVNGVACDPLPHSSTPSPTTP